MYAVADRSKCRANSLIINEAILHNIMEQTCDYYILLQY